ncbi:hypothetical protein EMCRGX_G024405 [Ephydatia muelleri]
MNGEFRIVFIGPELLITNPLWRQMVRLPVYVVHLVAFVVDEAHCVTKWVGSFAKTAQVHLVFSRQNYIDALRRVIRRTGGGHSQGVNSHLHSSGMTAVDYDFIKQ